MGRLKYFQIKLVDRPSGVFFGGDVVRGKIFIGLEGNGKKARGKEEKKDANKMQTLLSYIVTLFRWVTSKNKLGACVDLR